MICTTVFGKSVDEALEAMLVAQKEGDCIELALDEISGIDEKGLEKLVFAAQKKVIVRVREKAHGGKFDGSASEKVKLLKKAVETGADFVEIDHSIPQKTRSELMQNAKSKTKFIVAKYFTSHTPLQIELLRELEQLARTDGARIVKIVTSAKTAQDNSTIIGLVKESKKMGINLIAYCEGAFGRDSRILSLPFGGFLTYASAGSEPDLNNGEISAKELKKIYTGLKFLL